jgi:hypothetical protein
MLVVDCILVGSVTHSFHSKTFFILGPDDLHGRDDLWFPDSAN